MQSRSVTRLSKYLEALMTRRLSTLLSLPVFFVLLFLTGPSPATSHSLKENPSSPSWDPACYQTNEQTLAFLQNIAATYPQLAILPM